MYVSMCHMSSCSVYIMCAHVKLAYFMFVGHILKGTVTSCAHALLAVQIAV